jgi:prophage maintenance system killer protein
MPHFYDFVHARTHPKTTAHSAATVFLQNSDIQLTGQLNLLSTILEKLSSARLERNSPQFMETKVPLQ